ncbi:sugar kinase [Mesorhizobium sp.]|uniref:tagatose kinase n=1 Tax=Mesorhizobium sp. TaxID=1871066 RepID=UPI00121553FF|nr:sugar kinase [Mesorhizobium sp.]TIO05763.1 MAG: sugar kinase [Mesorhizobium sp.]TIO33157.1 MAG: sugar kinase [Mesorhizobium sp.]TIP08278.1 MAG: sugar kinase [Mesorhizobium sp.]
MIEGKILTIGEILVEIMATTLGRGFLELQPLIGPFPSGAPAIFIDQVGKLGHPAAIVSAVGDDDFGVLNLERLKRDGVDISAVAIHPGAATGSAFVRYRPDGGRDFVFNMRDSAAGRIVATPEARAVLAEAGHLHVMGSGLPVPAVFAMIRDAIPAIKARGGTVSFDPNIRVEMLRDPAGKAAFQTVLAATDIFLPSGEELSLFSGASDEESAIAALLETGVNEIVLKRGAAGASHFDRNGATHMPGFVVEEIDPTGAGDSFGATFLVARRLGKSIPDALRYANAAGARTVTVKGPMEGTSSFADLDSFIAGAIIKGTA